MHAAFCSSGPLFSTEYVHESPANFPQVIFPVRSVHPSAVPVVLPARSTPSFHRAVCLILPQVLRERL